MLYHLEDIPPSLINPTEGGVELEEALKWARLWEARPILRRASGPLRLVDENGRECDEQGVPKGA